MNNVNPAVFAALAEMKADQAIEKLKQGDAKIELHSVNGCVDADIKGNPLKLCAMLSSLLTHICVNTLETLPVEQHEMISLLRVAVVHINDSALNVLNQNNTGCADDNL